MIEVSLCVDDICHNCPKFEPDYQHIQLKNYSGEFELNSITIKCTNSNLCSYIRKYLKKENENENDTRRKNSFI